MLHRNRDFDTQIIVNNNGSAEWLGFNSVHSRGFDGFVIIGNEVVKHVRHIGF